jgi:hypothetical protein
VCKYSQLRNNGETGIVVYLYDKELLLEFDTAILTLNKIYKTIILPVILYGCVTWCLTLRKECRLRVSENRALRRIFGPERDEVTGE